MERQTVIRNAILVALGAAAALFAAGLLTAALSGKNAKTLSLTRADAESKSTFVRSVMAECYKKNGANGCYRDAASLLLGNLPAREVLEVFRASEAQPEVFGRCHEVTHYIGRAIYREARSIPESYATCIPVCHGGCYHGVIEAHLKEQNLPFDRANDDRLKQHLASICGTKEDFAVPLLRSECLHGIGHALMFISDEDLPRALELCDALPAQGDRETCYGGVFMENSSSSTNPDHPSAYLKPDDSLYPCTILPERYLPLCYQYQSSYFAELSQWDWKNVVELCGTVPAQYREGCFTIMGSNQVGFTQDQAQRKANCDLIAEPAYRRACVMGVVNALGVRYVNAPEHMIEFCAVADAEYWGTCYEQMGAALRMWGLSEEERERVCENIPDGEALAACEK